MPPCPAWLLRHFLSVSYFFSCLPVSQSCTCSLAFAINQPHPHVEQTTAISRPAFSFQFSRSWTVRIATSIPHLCNVFIGPPPLHCSVAVSLYNILTLFCRCSAIVVTNFISISFFRLCFAVVLGREYACRPRVTRSPVLEFWFERDASSSSNILRSAFSARRGLTVVVVVVVIVVVVLTMAVTMPLTM